MISIPQLFNRNNSFFEKISGGKNLSPRNKLVKKYIIAQETSAITGMLFFLVVSWIISAKLIIEFCIVLIPCFILAIPIIIRSKNPEIFVLSIKCFVIVATTIYVVRMGGLITSGGLMIMALQAVTSTIILRKYSRMFFVYILFVVSVILLVVFEPFFPVENALNPKQNVIMFTCNLIGMAWFISLFTLYAVKLFSKMEQQETQRQKELNLAKTRLYTNITHEFRTPLTVIIGLADALKSQLNGAVQNKIQTIIKNGKNLLQLVDQMLDLSKLESGNLTVNKIHGNIIPFLRYIFQLQEYYAVEKEIEMTFNAESQSYELDFDPEKTTTIVSNLLSNAIKFTPSGGKINMNIHASNESVFIEIKDNGIGISKEKQKKIFERFYQVDDKNTRQAGGAGIGLALTKELINLLNGSIDVRSVLGKETVFTVKLPITSILKSKKKQYLFKNDAEVDLNNKEVLKDANFKTGTKQQLLIVEDNKDVIDYLQTCYQSYFEIEIAKNGNDGYGLAIKIIPDIIISDIMMPEMDGFELCKKLKDDYRTSHIPIILLTAKADLPSRIEGLEQGADAFIVKPFDQQELLVRMRKLLELRKKLHKRYSNGGNFELSTDPLIQKEDEFFGKLNKSITKNLNDENYNIHILCEDLAMSKSQLYRKFKALTNRSAAKYIRKLRMEKAKHLLQTTSMNITEIGYEVGMKSLSTFSQLFKEEFGVSPSEFSSKIHEKIDR